MTGTKGTPGGGAYDVGCGRPPEAGRFRKGMSGNPTGRPKGAKNRSRPESDRLRALIRREAYRPVKLRVDGAEVTLPLAQAAMRSLGTAAIKGETRALAIFLKHDAVMAELLEAAREAEMPGEIEIRIVDAVDGKRVGESRAYEPHGGESKTLDGMKTSGA